MDLWDEINRIGTGGTATWIGALFYGVVLLLLALLVGRAIRAGEARIIREGHLGDATAVAFFGQLLRAIVLLAAVVLYAHVIPPLRALGTALLAGVSIASLIIGLAAQSTLGNLVAGLVVVLYRPFSLGQRVQVGSPVGVQTGTVERLTLGYTVLRGDEGQNIVVPNSVMTTQVVVNLGRAPMTDEDPG
jgi:small-conductance mechanosensitive channel